jgi:hypothetical protein
MNARRIEITLSQERWEQLEAARGHEPRAAFIKRALESALGDGQAANRRARSSPVQPSAPIRAPRVPPGRTSREFESARELAMERQAKLNEAKS